MEERKCCVTIGGKSRYYKTGTSYQTIAEELQSEFEHDIVLVYVDGFHLQELRKSVTRDCELRFITTADPLGHEAYKRSICFLLVKAVHDVAGHEKIQDVRIHFSLDKGYYCTVKGDIQLDDEFLKNVDAMLRELSDE